jgi:hypothetical protein
VQGRTNAGPGRFGLLPSRGTCASCTSQDARSAPADLTMTDRRGLDWRSSVLLLVATVSLAAVWLLPPLPQDPLYHQFADGRTILGVPNFFNIASNLAFLLVGVAGLHQGIRHIPAMRVPWLVFFGGVTLVCLGSGYYHLRPDNGTLVWDRLPMSVAFMGLFVAVIGRRVNPRLETPLLVVAIAAGIASVLYWHYTDDLRLYAWVQFMPLLVIALTLILYPDADGRTRYLAVALALYLAGKVAEYYDRALFMFTDAFLSGHALKHLLSALAAYWILRMLRAEGASG